MKIAMNTSEFPEIRQNLGAYKIILLKIEVIDITNITFIQIINISITSKQSIPLSSKLSQKEKPLENVD